MNERNSKVSKTWIFAIVAFTLLMSTIDGTIVATALHTLQTELHTTVNWAGWTLTAYAFGFLVMLPLSAKYSIDFGHRRVFVASILTFTIASLLCGLVSSIYLLIPLRVLQAMGGAGFTPSATGIIVEYFGKDRDRAVGLFGSIFPIGAMIGPIFGGLFVTYLNWRYIFFVNVPIGILVILLTFRFIPKDKNVSTKSRNKTDVKGIVLLSLGVLLMMFAFAVLGEKGTKLYSPTFLILILSSITSVFLMFRHLKKSDYPFISMEFINGKRFAPVNLVNVIFGGTIQGIVALVPLYAAMTYHINALDSGTLLVAQGLAAVFLSTLFSFLIRKIGYRIPISIGVSLMIIGLLLMSFPPAFGFTPYFWLAVSTFLIGAGMGTMSPAARNAGLQLVPGQSATLAAIRSLGMQMGEIITISVATAIISMASFAHVHEWIHISIAVLYLCCLPIVYRIPEHKGVW